MTLYTCNIQFVAHRTIFGRKFPHQSAIHSDGLGFFCYVTRQNHSSPNGPSYPMFKLPDTHDNEPLHKEPAVHSSRPYDSFRIDDSTPSLSHVETVASWLTPLSVENSLTILLSVKCATSRWCVLIDAEASPGLESMSLLILSFFGNYLPVTSPVSDNTN